jgi:DNA polymerase II small subunit/DNA polymerase delta subunit B
VSKKLTNAQLQEDLAVLKQRIRRLVEDEKIRETTISTQVHALKQATKRRVEDLEVILRANASIVRLLAAAKTRSDFIAYQQGVINVYRADASTNTERHSEHVRKILEQEQEQLKKILEHFPDAETKLAVAE